ncbi:MAG: N-acetylmuramoyl-L-alanine amidase [Zoogloea sp.]|nr:N-acetylmuramoyl-L-alanine amidase [Zoogloea sp.]
MRGLGVLVSAVLLQGSVTAVAAQPVAIDVGHYLERPGAISAYGVSEFEYNHALAAVIAARLAGAGVLVRLIGHRGEMADLRARPREAEAAGAGLFLSIHHDSVKEGTPPAMDLEWPQPASRRGLRRFFAVRVAAQPAPGREPGLRQRHRRGPAPGRPAGGDPSWRVLGRCGTPVGRRGQRGVFLRQPGGAEDRDHPGRAAGGGGDRESG